MVAHNVSPGSALLRSSRLFSIPPPLPKQMIDLKTNGIHSSDSATLPYPTHLAITTPPSSLCRGDWGLKRPLPLRSTTQTSTPHIRIKSIDALEHVTDFESATNHTLTLQKWQEMGLPFSTPGTPNGAFYLANYRAKGMGVFEEDTNSSKSNRDSHQWKFKGPWLAGQTALEFNEYIQNEIRKRKSEFQDFLREIKAREDTKAAQREAKETMESAPPPIKPRDITNDQMRQYTRELRFDRTTLFKLIRQFFDLPPSSSKLAALRNHAQMNEAPGTAILDLGLPELKDEMFLPDSDSPYAVTGPPKTHPSAGLSYLRTDSKLYNHPMHGPQEQPPPVLGRIVQPKYALGATSAKVGIAGVIVNAPPTMDSFKSKGRSKLSHPGINYIEPDREGGSKIWLRPTSARIDPQGRIDLKVVEDSRASSAIKGENSWRIPLQRPQPFEKPPNTALGGYGLDAFHVHRDKTHIGLSNKGPDGSTTGSAAQISDNKILATAMYAKMMANEDCGL